MYGIFLISESDAAHSIIKMRKQIWNCVLISNFSKNYRPAESVVKAADVHKVYSRFSLILNFGNF